MTYHSKKVFVTVRKIKDRFVRETKVLNESTIRPTDLTLRELVKEYLRKHAREFEQPEVQTLRHKIEMELSK